MARFWLLCVWRLCASATSAAKAPGLLSAAPYSNVIASQLAFGENSAATWFDGLPIYHVPPADAPSVPPASPSRDMAFGSPLAFSVFPLNPASTFSLTLLFLDDANGYHRRLALTANGVPIGAPSIALPPKALFNATLIVPSSAVAKLPNGALGLALSLSALAGPNAVLSGFSLASSNAADPPIAPPAAPVPSHALPRLTPRPASVAGAGPLTVDLNGAWDFDPAGGAAFPASLSVPGEYTLQGFRVPQGAPVAYRRAFEVPSSWAALRTKLRFDGVSSNATVFVNGAPVGGHLGGFTPFELDVTAAVVPGGANSLTVVVQGFSEADLLASASQYAAHDIGGITRKVYLMAVPPVSIADVHAVPTFTDASRATADLLLNVSLANDGAAATGAATTVEVALSFGGAPPCAAGRLVFPAGLAPGGVAFAAASLRVDAPLLWDPEHPRLYNLTLTLPTQSVVRRVGFRDVAVVGNRVVINGRPIKARGTTRHEVHPLVGRALWALEPEGKAWERDIIAFRDANVNYIRTSHYPPPEELMEAADELGMLIELEMPFCWARANSGAGDFNYTVQAQREAMVFNRNHPSVITWSLGNESPWLANFANSLAMYLREVDWTRPFMFDGGDGQAIPPLDIISIHYPRFDVPPSLANASYPTLFGEYAHLNCYNRRELAADPGVRDIWGLGVEHMWELIYASPGVLGACYWAGIDEYFYMPGGKPVGYGEWGVIDAWRRPKPETFLVRNIYAPVKLAIPAPGSAWAPTLTVANRFDFSDLSEVAFSWAILGTGSSGAGAAAGGPHTAGLPLTLAGLPPSPLSGVMQINATSARGFLLNSWQFPLSAADAGAAPPRRARAAGGAAPPPQVVELPDGRLRIQDAAGSFTWFVAPGDGAVSGNTSAGALLASGPGLMVLPINGEGGKQLTEDMPPILPFNDPLANWTLRSRAFDTNAAAVVVTLRGDFSGASGAFALAFDGAARLTASYNFTWTAAGKTSPRQVGLVFGVPPALGFLSWRRATPLAAPYPADHIGRAAGDLVPANAGPPPGNATRTGSWCNDPSPLGDADFRSTRHNFTVFELSDASRAAALALVSDGASQHGRAWVAPGGVSLLAADLSNEGGNPFSREAVLPHVELTAGAVISGAATLQLGSALA